MKKLVVAGVLIAGCFGMGAYAQGAGNGMPAAAQNGPILSPRHDADVVLKGKTVHISYGAPSLRGRKAAGELMPYNTWWRTGANEATTFETTGDMMVGTLVVPAGKYTLVTLPSAGTWDLVLCKHTGQWGTERFAEEDLGRTAMKKAVLRAPQEVMSIAFEKTAGARTQLHIKWETTDVWVPVSVDEKHGFKTGGPAAHFQPLSSSPAK